jgi:serine/threonine protein kinase/Tfp pilus assembly protein PilF
MADAEAKAIFFEALERQTSEELAQFLDQACRGDAALRAQVEELWQAHREAGQFLGGTDPPDATAVQPLAEQPGTVIGPYKLLQQLGEGGMGTVYLAEQDQPVKRRVALKIIKAGMDSRRVIARFEQERQALALMDHPNIAKVLDAGTTISPLANVLSTISPLAPCGRGDGGEGAGRPYFVMELVKGLPITQYCDQERLTPKERLELFIPVCQAVQHAHQKGIIHRDLKPSNVMVALYDGKPIPKVIDFGVAKATGRSLAERTLYTEVGMLVGTLEYMAPEQAEVNNLDIDTRADIYSLGVLLYELLTGSPPFTSKELRTAGYDAMMRMIREVEPPKPSTKLSSSDELPSIAANRNLEPKSLRKLVAGELDWIAMKCLEKERGRRYETANGLAMDVQRYLADEPVAAGPPSKVYRMRKFVRRNRGPVVAVSFVLLALIAGVIGTTWGLIRAEVEKKLALKRLGQIEKSSEILGSIFTELDPRAEEKEGKPLRALMGERLDKAVAELDGEAVGDPLAAANLQFTLAKSLMGLGYPQKAIPLYIQARETFTKLLGPDHIQTLASMYSIASAYRDAGKLDLALPLMEEAVTLMKEKLGSDHAETLVARSNLAALYADTGRFSLALQQFEETLEIRRVKLGPNHPDTLVSLNAVAVSYLRAGKLDQALPRHEETLKLRRTILGPDHPDTLLTLYNLASAYREAGKLDSAVPLCEEALNRRSATLGRDHPATLESMNGLATCHRDAKRYDLAVPLFEEILKLRKAKRGPDHPETLLSMNNLADGYSHSRKPELAQPLYEEAVRLSKAKLGPEHPDTLMRMGNLATFHLYYGRFELALPLQEEVVKRQKQSTGPNHPQTLQSMSNLATGYLNAGKIQLAIPLYEETVSLLKVNPGRDHHSTLSSMYGLARAYDAAGKTELAGLQFQETAEGIERLKFMHPDAGRILENMCKYFEKLKQFERAEDWRRKWIAFAKARVGAESPKYGRALVPLGANLVAQKKYFEAESILRESRAILETKESELWRTSTLKSLLGAAVLGQEKYLEAESLLLQGYEGLRQSEEKFPSEAKLPLIETVERLVQLYDAWGKPEEAEKWRAKLPKKTGEGDAPPEKK